jgi:hypothetical protein
MVTLKLSNPLTADQARRLHARDDKDYSTPGAEITVPRDSARALIDAGYAAGVEPADEEAVEEVLKTEGKAAKVKVDKG